MLILFQSEHQLHCDPGIRRRRSRDGCRGELLRNGVHV